MEFAGPARSGGCCWSGCGADGKFPAPKPEMRTNERYYFCLAHIREYNNYWDFFYKMDREQIERVQNEMLLNNRPTWKFGVDGINLTNIEAIRRQVFGEFRNSGKSAPGVGAASSHLPKPVQAALKVMGLERDVTPLEIKKKYKQLAKAHHPDLKKGSDERIKAINNAYNVLKASINYKP
jgi:DnaJ-domain-containing protein 1